jgi:glycogen(starch) synthase
MKIWLVPSAFFPHRGGVEELTLKLAQQLQARGHQLLVIVHRNPSDLPEDDIVEEVRVRRIDFPSPGRRPRQFLHFLGAQLMVQRVLGRLEPQPDVVHIQCPSNQTLSTALYTRRKRLPLIVTSQGEVVMDAHQVFQRSAYMRWSLRLASRWAAALTACSSWTARQAAEIAPRFATAQSILNGVDPEDWIVDPPPSDPVICAWGRHVPQKGLDLAIRAFEGVRRAVPGARLLVGGDGTERERLMSLAGPAVEFLGPLDRNGVRLMLQQARVAVVPSRIEPFGIVALEALAAGRNLVYSNRGGLSEAAGRCGVAVDPENVPALSSAIVRALRSPVDVVANRERASEISWSRITRAYEQIYEAYAW